jgi:hypothetical protein
MFTFLLYLIYNTARYNICDYRTKSNEECNSDKSSNIQLSYILQIRRLISPKGYYHHVRQLAQ